MRRIHPAIVGIAVLGLGAVNVAQAQRGAVPLEAADCSRARTTFGDDEVANAVQYASVPAGVGILDVRPGGNGGVRIERGSGGAYSITACIAAGADTLAEAQRAVESVRLVVEGNRVRVTDGGTNARSWSVQLIVEAPSGAQMDVETVNGPIGLTGVDGSITARATNGPISLNDVSASVRAVAVNGPISVFGSRGNVDVETQNGPITVELRGTRWEGELQARAKNGPLTIRVPEAYSSGLEVSSSSRSPWSCRIAACSDAARNWDDSARTLRIGPEPVNVKISTVNGPVTLDRTR